MSNLKTIIHTYRFNLDKPKDAKAYGELLVNFDAGNIKPHKFLSHQHTIKLSELPDGKEIELETEFLFSDQWNGIELRLFDWYEVIYPNPKIVEGYWLEITPEMKEIRQNRYACGFCGRQEDAQKGNLFCGQCIDSEYLKESELYLTRMQSVLLGRDNRKPLTEREKERLIPEYRHAQLYGATTRGIARLKKQREDIEKKYKRETENAKAEHDGMLWLLDHGLKIDNVIFYDHTGRFSFGWRSPVSEEFKSELLNIISEFPFPYDITTADRKLSGD